MVEERGNRPDNPGTFPVLGDEAMAHVQQGNGAKIRPGNWPVLQCCGFGVSLVAFLVMGEIAFLKKNPVAISKNSRVNQQVNAKRDENCCHEETKSKGEASPIVRGNKEGDCAQDGKADAGSLLHVSQRFCGLGAPTNGSLDTILELERGLLELLKLRELHVLENQQANARSNEEHHDANACDTHRIWRNVHRIKVKRVFAVCCKRDKKRGPQDKEGNCTCRGARSSCDCIQVFGGCVERNAELRCHSFAGRCVVSGRFANGAAVSAVRGAAYGACGSGIRRVNLPRRGRIINSDGSGWKLFKLVFEQVVCGNAKELAHSHNLLNIRHGSHRLPFRN